MHRFCVIGSGPAGFYVSKRLLQKMPNVSIDMFEKNLLPFGLLRDAVAPDHQDIRNIIWKFDDVLHHPSFNFYGNVNIGSDLRVSDLIQNYDTIILCHGSSIPQKLGVKGENLRNIFSGIEIAKWYNGSLGSSNINPELSSSTIVLFGIGNVALDVARIFLTPTTELEKLDIPSEIITKLKELNSNLKRVVIVGRKTLFSSRFTAKQLRNMQKITNTKIYRCCDYSEVVAPVLFSESITTKFPRLATIINSIPEYQEFDQIPINDDPACKQLIFLSCHQPVEFLPQLCSKLDHQNVDIGSKLGKVVLQKLIPKISHSSLSYDLCEDKKLEISSNLAVKCIGHVGFQLDSAIPFLHEESKIVHSEGKINSLFEKKKNTELFCAGWAKTFSQGTIATTMQDCHLVADKIIQEMDSSTFKDRMPSIESNNSSNECFEILKNKGVFVTSVQHWQLVDELEKLQGEKYGKIREKITSREELLNQLTKLS